MVAAQESNQTQSGSDNNVISRRRFLSKGIVSAGSLILLSGSIGSSALARALGHPKLDLSSLQGKFEGKLVSPQDEDFNKLVFGGLWNKLYPKRAPQLLAQVSSDKDVITIIKYARANKLKVCVRGGGHNWCAPSIRNSGILIDLTNLNKVISIDAKARRAIVQPIISNREMQACLKPYNLAFPSGHCPPVKLSGYLLGGGMAWNQGVWGPGVESVEAIEMVTPDGELITASAKENQDYYWAARGAGSGLFAVALRYHLKLYPLPKALTASVYYYPYENVVEVAQWLGPLASKLPNNVELSQFVITAPPELAEQCKSSAGKVCLVTATMFAEDLTDAQNTLKALDTCPIIDKCLSKSIAQPTDFEKLFDASGDLWPGNLRCRVDALFSNSSIADIFKALKDHLLESKSPKAVFMFALFTGSNVPAPLPDAAFSMSAKLYGGSWTMWDKPGDDAENKKWHEKCIALLGPFIAGHYVSESDTTGHPDYAKASYKEANWKRLGELRKKYDPEGVFFDYSGGLS